MSIKRLQPKNDFIFQRIFGKKENEEILLSFLNAILNFSPEKKLTKIKILENTKLEQERIEDKTGILDVRAETVDGTQINIEIQLVNQYNMEKRTLFYWAKLFIEPFKPGQNFKELKKTITINILDFNCLDIKGYHSTYHLWEDHEKDYLLTDIIEIHFLELPKFREEKVNLKNPLHRWLMFLDNAKEDVLEVLKMEDPTIAKAEEILEWLSCDEETLRLYELREKALHDEVTRIEGAKEEGYLQGIEKGKIEVAKNMLKEGLDIELVVKISGLPEVDRKKSL